MNVLDRFREVNRAFPKTSQILEHKSHGKKVFGWLCTYVPEEIIHAAGALPIRIIGYSHEAELDEGVRMMSRVEGIAPGEVAIDMPVTAFVGEAEGVPAVLFKPSEG